VSPNDTTRKRAARLLLEDGTARLALLALSERDVQRLLEQAVVCIAEALAVEHAQIFELLPDGNTLISRAAFGGERRTPNRLKLEKPAGSQASFTLAANSPVIVHDLARETRFRPSRLQKTLGVVTAAATLDLCLRTNFELRYESVGFRALTGSPSRTRPTSSENCSTEP